MAARKRVDLRRRPGELRYADLGMKRVLFVDDDILVMASEQRRR
jgi:hypothetical protein